MVSVTSDLFACEYEVMLLYLTVWYSHFLEQSLSVISMMQPSQASHKTFYYHKPKQCKSIYPIRISRCMTNQQHGVWVQQRLRSVWASTKSDQSLRWSREEALRSKLHSWVKVFRIIPEFMILRLTFHRKSASKS